MAHDPSSWRQPHFGIRPGDTVGLNVDDGLGAAEDVDATVGTGVVFRIRFVVEEFAGGADSTGFKLQVKRNTGSFVDVDVLGGASAPAVLANVSSQYTDGDVTSSLLTNPSTFVAGDGNEDNLTGSLALTNQTTELEFALRIMSFHDGPTQNVADDTLEFRVVEADGTVFTGAYTNPVVTVSETAGYIGATMIETPMKVGPYVDGNGSIYYICEFAESENTLALIKSADGGDTWREMDGANRPTTADIEGADMVQDAAEFDLHMCVHNGTTVAYNKFRTSDHPTNADTWEITDESVATPTDFTTQVVSMAILSDNVLWCFYVDGTSPRRVRYKKRNGTWGSELTLDSEASKDFQSPSCVVGASDLVHVFYKDDTAGEGEIFHRSLASDGTLSGRNSVVTGVDAGSSNSDNCQHCEAVYYDSGGDEKIVIAYEKSSGSHVFTRTRTNDSSFATEQDATDQGVDHEKGGSNQSMHSMTVDGATLHLLYIHDADNDISRTESDDGGSWNTDTEIEDAVTAHWVRAQVITHSTGNGGDKVLAYCWDNGSAGGTGRIRYDEVVLSSVQTATVVEIASGQVIPVPTLTNVNTTTPTEITSGQSIPAPTASLLTTLSPVEIASGQSVSLTTLTPGGVNVSPVEIASGQTIPVPTLLSVSTLLPIEIESGSVVPVLVLLNVNTLTMIDIPTGQVIPAPILSPGGVSVSPFEIVSGQAVNIPILLNVNTLASTEIASGQAFGTPLLNSLATITVVEIASGQVVSIPVLIPEQFITPVSIDSGQIVSTPTLNNLNTIITVEVLGGSLVSVPGLSSLATLSPSDIPSGQAIPVPVLVSGLTITVVEIVSGQAFDVLTLLPGDVTLTTIEIASGQVIPIPIISSLNTLTVTEITSGQVVSISVLTTLATISPVEIASGQAVSFHTVTSGLTVLPAEIQSGQVTPSPTLTPGAVTLASVEIASGQVFDVLTLISGTIVSPVEIPSGSFVSVPQVLAVAFISPTEILSGQSVPGPSLASLNVLTAVEIMSGQVIPVLSLSPGGVSVAPVAILSGQVIPAPGLSSAVVLSLVEIASGSLVSTPALSLAFTLSPVEIVSGSVVPIVTLTPGVLVVSPVEISSGSMVSIPAFTIVQTISPVAILSGQIVPNPVILGGGGIVILFRGQTAVVTFDTQPGTIQFADQPGVITYEVD